MRNRKLGGVFPALFSGVLTGNDVSRRGGRVRMRTPGSWGFPPFFRVFSNRMRASHRRERPSGSRDLRSLRVTFHNVTYDEKAPLGRILRNLRFRMRTPKGTPSESRDLRSLPVAIVLYYILYLY